MESGRRAGARGAWERMAAAEVRAVDGGGVAAVVSGAPQAGSVAGDGAEAPAVVRGERILSLSALLPKIGDLSKSTLWELVRAAAFPAPIQITVNRVGWLESEVDAWIARRRMGPRGAVDGAQGMERKGGTPMRRRIGGRGRA
jgi:prophage regulatory protein